MGRSAKLHKRIPKKLKTTSSSSNTTSTPSTTSIPSQSKAQNAKRRADLKAKAAKTKSSASTGQKEGHVLGGADYVSLLLGGRRKAQEEAEKLPRDED
ncbi:hypothetical protein AX14_006141 [Amanita brunnescens Koide BX004]|nr:hypothetical protein AX14_006141 [Amanita brunnescens Koide BX004]